MCGAGVAAGGAGTAAGGPEPGDGGPPAHAGGRAVRQGHHQPGPHPEPHTQGPAGRAAERLRQTGESHSRLNGQRMDLLLTDYRY